MGNMATIKHPVGNWGWISNRLLTRELRCVQPHLTSSRTTSSARTQILIVLPSFASPVRFRDENVEIAFRVIASKLHKSRFFSSKVFTNLTFIYKKVVQFSKLVVFPILKEKPTWYCMDLVFNNYIRTVIYMPDVNSAFKVRDIKTLGIVLYSSAQSINVEISLTKKTKTDA